MGLDDGQRSFLEREFGERVTFDETERKLYGHDIAAMPKLVKPLIGSTVPDAVVQPEDREELVKLVRWSREQKIPLVPRGKASSGYGGAVPVKGGVVVDFYRMRDVLSIDGDRCEVTVEPGISWESLDRELARRGLTLRLYPSSYPSSTAGGWLAQGGAGFGSYEFGYFRDNVASAEVVLPDGSVKEFSGQDLDLVSDAEGTTGLISRLTLKVQPLEELEVMAFESTTAAGLQALLEAVIGRDLPVWSIMFINPRMAEMRNRAPAGHHDADKPTLPLSYITVITFRRKDSSTLRPALLEYADRAGAEPLPEEIARHEWDNRFKIMLVKRLGPSLVPAEVIIPVDRLGLSMTEMESNVSQPVLKEGIIVKAGRGGRPEAVLLGFIPADERTLGYNMIFALSLSIMRIAERHGGRAYAPGMYFTGKARKILGAGRVKRLRELRDRLDPGRLMNPGKVTEGGLLGLFIKVAGLFEPLARPIANRVASRVGERPGGESRGIPGDVAWYAYSCSQCGYCVDSCDEFYGRGWESHSPRGKWYWLREYLEGRAQWDQRMVDTFLVCTTCEMCDTRCSAGLPIEHSWMKLRGDLVQRDGRMTFPPFEMMAAALESQGDIWAGYRKDRGAWFPEELRQKHGPGARSKNVYFAGCTASYVENDIGMATTRLLDEAGLDYTYLGEEESCCGTPMLVAGKWDLFADIMKKNISAVREAGADTVICSCPACDMMWRKVYPEWCEKLGIDYGITARHYSEVLAEKLASGEFEFPRRQTPETVTWHDSCHIGRASGVFEPPRDLIRATGAELSEMDHNREEGLCCGSVLTLIKEPAVAAEIGKDRLDEVARTGADKVLSLCPCCEFQLRVTAGKKGVPVEVVDLARYTAGALGYEFPDPNPEVAEQWAVFEAMISLMTPEGFAELMGTMWPELIDAMPLGMGRMMRFIGRRMPFALEGMKPLFPVLFPRLLPLMMPKVMPVMLERVAGKVPMPEYMREQMPELMPKVMDNLMPHMIGEVVPLVTGPMIEYLERG